LETKFQAGAFQGATDQCRSSPQCASSSENENGGNNKPTKFDNEHGVTE
jgi:hypothetical protein